ncbi:MAG: signal peptidase I, partial [Bacillota bacterium]|nr:signal peptidase I [Bacillota bacterium]
LAVIVALVIRMFLVEVYIVDGNSMQPSLHDRERVLVNKLVYRFKGPEPQDVIVFRYPKEPDRDFIKRVVAVPGQTVEVKNGKVFVDGQATEEPYLKTPTHGAFGPEVVPANTLFVMGDNRNFSLDSRDPSVGFVPIANIKGKAMVIFWPLPSLGLIPH